ncbi:WASH complex subunit 2 [Hetaerina americana]|uniref:WASH complex subunit 2 n=1 Tax=Hetaerina americana TaxID=62018 RepID=UPI003A7F4462
MDDSNIQKVWERPWSTEEMRAHCSNWNLAGDAGLLKHLQEFSQNLMQKTHTAEVALDSLLEDMRNTSVDVQNATNALLMLSNNQFVENRVYDDCEDEKEEEVGSKGDGGKGALAGACVVGGEAALVAKAAEAILLGMSVIDTKFDCVEVPASDSEGEEDAQDASRDSRKSFAVVLEPRNPYALQPLPHLIGSKEFMEDDRVGLGGDEDEDEEDDEEEDEEDAHLSIGQDLVAQGLNDSGSSLTGDMGDEGLFDEDEVEDQKGPKASGNRAWESSSSNDSDDLVVENNAIRKKLKKSTVSPDDEGPFGHDGVDIFGGKETSSGDEFPPLAHTNEEPPAMPPRKSYKEDLDNEVATKPVAVNRKKSDEPAKKKTNNITSNATGPKTHSIPSDNLFGPPKDEWKDDEDGDSIFTATDGIFSGGRGLFDDLDDPFATTDRRDAKQYQPSHLPDKPPAYKGTSDETTAVSSRHSKGDIFGDNDDDQDVFSHILAKAKPPNQKQETTQEVTPRKKPGSAQGKDLKGARAEDAVDSWLFGDEADLDDPLWSVDTISKKDKIFESDEEAGEAARGGYGPSQGDEAGSQGGAPPQPKLPIGARSFYAGGIDPFALGKKLTKELEDKQKMQDRESDDDLGKVDVSPKIAVPERSDDALGENSEKKSVSEAKHSPDSESLFDGEGESDDLFAPVSTKANKAKDATSGNKGDLFDGSIFAHQKAPVFSTKFDDKQRKYDKKTPFGDVDCSKNLFGDFASDDDDGIFSSASTLKAQPSTPKLPPPKGKKASIDSSDPLFDDGLGKDEELFPGLLREDIFSEKEVDDDLFSGLMKKEEGKSVKNNKKESSNLIKTEFQVPLSGDGDNVGIGDTKNISHVKKTSDTSDNLFGPEDVISTKKNDAKALKKTEAPRDSKEKRTSHRKNKSETDDIFGSTESKPSMLPGAKSVTGVPSIDVLSRISGEDGAIAESKSYSKSEKGSKLESLFNDLNEDDDSNFLSSKKHIPGKSVQPPPPPLVEASSVTKKMNGKDLFTEVDSDGDDQKFSTPKGGKIKADPLHVNDPLGQEDDLFSVEKATPLLLDEEPLVFSFDSERKKTEPSHNKGSSKVDAVVPGKGRILVGEDGAVPSAGSGARKSPPKTLNLEKVIPSPKPANKVVDLCDDFRGSNDGEDDKIVQAWMKGHPPPLRDSKVETATDDDITPGYTPAKPYNDFGPPRNDDQESSYFADIPSASLLHSHGKERARIQSHRRPPSRKVRKGSAVSVDPLPVAPMDEGKPEPPLSSIATLPSRDSVEEDRGSQGTVEEWSTPEAALASPPPTLPPTITSTPPPLSNPLSPSTDEEQDFFDVLPIGHYPPPPPVGPSSSSLHLSPFSDALGAVEDLWDKDDGALFEDAQPMEQGSVGAALWGASTLLSDTPDSDAGWTPTEDGGGHEGGSRRGKASVRGGVDEGKSNSQVARSPASGKAEIEEESILPKKVKKSQGKQELGKLDDDLWGNGFSSRLTDDIFAEDMDSTQTGDFDDLFQGQGGDLFGPSRVSAAVQEPKKVAVGNAGDKSMGMGKSLSKLDSKSKAPVSLFDDDDDTEDLFSPHSSQPAPKKGSATARKASTTKAVAPEQPVKSSLLKVAANDSIFEDPLMVLKRKE